MFKGFLKYSMSTVWQRNGRERKEGKKDETKETQRET
jgi:hypothetical protein